MSKKLKVIRIVLLLIQSLAEAATITVTKDDKSQYSVQFELVKEAPLKIKIDQGVTTFVAGYRTNNGDWYQWEKEKNVEESKEKKEDKYSWIKVDSEYKNKSITGNSYSAVIKNLNKAYEYVKNQNASSEEELLEDCGYFCKGEKLIDYNAASGIAMYNALTIFDEEEGEFIIGYMHKDKHHIIKFRSKENLGILKSKAGLNSREQIWKKTETWLKQENKAELKDSKSEILLYKYIGRLIRTKLEKKYPFEDLYKKEESKLEEAEYYYVKYLELCQKQNYNVYTLLERQKSEEHKELYNNNNYKRYSESEIENQKTIADSFLTTKVVEKKVVDNKKRTKSKDPILIPYMTNGLDDIESYNDKMSWINKYVSGEPKGSYKGAGSDSWGLIAVIFDYKRKEYKNKNKYTIEGNRIENKEEKNLNVYTVIIPNKEQVEAGDILEIKTGKNSYGSYVTETEPKINSLEDITVIYMSDEKKHAEKISVAELLNEIKDVKEITFRRIMKKTGNIKELEIPAWDVMDDRIVESSLRIEKIREQRQTSADKYRFIPNNGEYLILHSIKGKLYNKIGMELEGEEQGLIFIGAEDRNYSASEVSKGNLEKNKAEIFEVVLLNYDNSTSVTGDMIRDSFGQYKVCDKENNEIKPEVKIQGGILKYNNLPLRIGIRPKDMQSSYTGDDLVMMFGTKDENQGGNIKIEEDYLTVYDKKMIWRANLYLNKSERELGLIDWNNGHPWNEVEGWGKNEWNYKLNFNSENGTFTKTSANGDQCISFPNWTSRRNGEKKDAVAYDYPYKKDGTKGEIKAWDSPFNFYYKINFQRYALQKQFKAMIDAVSEEKEKEKVKKETESLFPDGKGGYIAGNGENVRDLSNWGVTTAPNKKWEFYWKEPVKEGDKEYKSYIPGLGMYIHDLESNENKYNLNLSFASRYSAGVDCLGLVVQSKSYTDNPYVKWSNIPENSLNYDASDNGIREYTNGNTEIHYPHKQGATVEIVNREKMGYVDGDNKGHEYFTATVGDDEGPTEEAFNNYKNAFLKVTPGDIIRYGKDGASHIGIIADVDGWGIQKATSIYRMLECIKVIESTYGGAEDNVIKRKITDGLAPVMVGKDYYETGSWFYNYYYPEEKITMRNFIIERLLTE